MDSKVPKKNKAVTTIATTQTDCNNGKNGYGVVAARPKLLFHLKIGSEKTKDATASKEEKKEEKTESPNVLPWNLRSSKRGELKTDDEKKPNCSLQLELSKEEIMEDFIAITGHPPPAKPIKRPKAVQKELDNLTPGSWLTNVTVNDYKVPHSPNLSSVLSMKEMKDKGKSKGKLGKGKSKGS